MSDCPMITVLAELAAPKGQHALATYATFAPYRTTQLNAQSSVFWQFIATQDKSQRPLDRATTVSSRAPVLFRRERRSAFPTEARNSYPYSAYRGIL